MSRHILSRPRTRVYGCNYDKGESYYKPMVDHLDRKYSGRPLFSEPRNSLADEIAARRSDIGSRGLSGNYSEFDDFDFYDGRGRMIPEENMDEDYVATHRRFRERAAAAFEEDLAELRRKRRDMQDRMFDMIDLNAEIERAKTTLEQADSAFQRHSLKFNNQEEDVENMSLAQRIERNRKLAAIDVSDNPEPKPKPPRVKWMKVDSPEKDQPPTALRSRINSLFADNVSSENPFSNPSLSKRKKSTSF
ncbi:uncharacterized protein LOC127285160 isoform X2 [Leptopilina boulardi]|uniref:uncharacterized protein LOC127285160 isoform X2 n=1 Tax=Leptopilina boulardi TaxID=63433 RepID=UPI0021F6547A|nr:uncharacterized protein LOC127285160 isoform X2 [Leptopilina boulardi]